MKHLIVVAHPVATSLTMALTRAYAAELQQLGHQLQTCDLYRMGFNPVLGASELTPASVDHAAEPDVLAAQESVRAADVMSVIYPLWWLSMPAMLKGYIDRVFARGFAYEAYDGLVHGLLAGKKCLLITLSGAPLPALLQDGRWNAAQVLQDTHIFRAAGFELLEHLHFDAVQPNLPDGIGERYLARVRSCARQHFSTECTIATTT
jgi:NAD(P)H dehydrogenase (quinone)